MSGLPITIVGAGLAGLTLGRSLRQKGIQAIIHERATSAPRHCHQITLKSSTYRKLLSILQLDEDTFRANVSGGAHRNGRDHLGNSMAIAFPDDRSFCCDRGRLELLLREGQDIEWDHTLTGVKLSTRSHLITALFHGREGVDSQLLVGCDGVHSVTRQTLSNRMQLKVLPYIVFNGRRRYSPAEYRKTLAPYLEDTLVIQTRKRDVRLEISLSEHSASTVVVSYTYSRAAKDGHDPLHRPNREAREAMEIPEEFYVELKELGITDQPFHDTFDVEKVRKDRVLHWLMRSMTPDPEEARGLAMHGVCLIGDALCATPILGGEGANMAITDGLELAEQIADQGVQGLQSFMSSRLQQCEKEVLNSEHRLEEMHSTSLE